MTVHEKLPIWGPQGRTLEILKMLYISGFLEFFQKKLDKVFDYMYSLQKYFIRGNPRKVHVQYGSGSLIPKRGFRGARNKFLKNIVLLVSDSILRIR